MQAKQRGLEFKALLQEVPTDGIRSYWKGHAQVFYAFAILVRFVPTLDSYVGGEKEASRKKAKATFAG